MAFCLMTFSFPFENCLGQDWELAGNSGTNPTNDFLGTTDATDLVLRTNNTQRLRILSGGNVGINLSTPQNLLHVHNGILQITNGTTGSGSTAGILIGVNGSSAQFQQQENAPMLFLVNNATARMNIAPGGNVAIGIGSTAGGRKLEM